MPRGDSRLGREQMSQQWREEAESKAGLKWSPLLVGPSMCALLREEAAPGAGLIWPRKPSGSPAEVAGRQRASPGPHGDQPLPRPAESSGRPGRPWRATRLEEASDTRGLHPGPTSPEAGQEEQKLQKCAWETWEMILFPSHLPRPGGSRCDRGAVSLGFLNGNRAPAGRNRRHHWC